MTTLAIMKAEIADDLERSDLTSQIANAISAAITHWQAERFYFNESRLSTFATVAAQSIYTTADDADIPKFLKIDYVKVIDSDNQVYALCRTDPEVMESLLGNGASSGRPDSYGYFEESFRLSPIPDAVYTIRPVGFVLKIEPASDGETGNVWMTAAYDLIKAEATERIAKNVVRDADLVAISRDAISKALSKLYAMSSRKTATGQIRPTQTL